MSFSLLSILPTAWMVTAKRTIHGFPNYGKNSGARLLWSWRAHGHRELGVRRQESGVRRAVLNAKINSSVFLRRNYNGTQQYKEKTNRQNAHHGDHFHSVVRRAPDEAGPGEQFICQGRAVRVPAHSHGVHILFYPRLIYRKFLDGNGYRGGGEEKGGKVACMTLLEQRLILFILTQ